MLTSVLMMRAQEKVKRELAEIKDAKTQLERELERKNRQLLSAESEPAVAPAPAAEEAPEAAEEPEEQEEEEPEEENKEVEASPVVVRTRRTRRALAAIENEKKEKETVAAPKRVMTRRSARTRGAAPVRRAPPHHSCASCAIGLNL